MRCECCDARLTAYEATMKHAETGQYLNTCEDCLRQIRKDVKLRTENRYDLRDVVEDDVLADKAPQGGVDWSGYDAWADFNDRTD